MIGIAALLGFVIETQMTQVSACTSRGSLALTTESSMSRQLSVIDNHSSYCE